MKIKFKMTVERLILTILILGYLVQVPSYLTKRACTKVEGKVTTVLDLAKSPHKEKYIEAVISNSEEENKEFFQLVLTSEMIGQSKYIRRIFENPYAKPIFSYSFYGDSVIPIKITNKRKAMLTSFELYEYDNYLYIKVYYAVDSALNYYTAVYAYTDIDKERIKELSENL